MWGGRFAASPDALMAAINQSLPVDRRMYREDIAGSIAHATMLGTTGVLAAEDVTAIIEGLQDIRTALDNGEPILDPAAEDIHMAIEAALTQRIGAVGGKLHTARSRNDQVATDFRMWMREALAELGAMVQRLQSVLLDHAEAHCHTVMPGFTHLQVAQPISLAHHLLAYVAVLGRDHGRLCDARTRLNESPLGSAALAGTPYPIDRYETASLLGFARPCANAMDGVSARDFALEALAALTILATTLSRLAEEIVIWSTPRFGFVVLPDQWSTGSSIMPQKRNPDAAELIRAKPGGALGGFVTLVTMLKGLPMAYSKDLQEDKATAFRAFDDSMLCVSVMAEMVAALSFNPEAMRIAVEQGFPTATDLADHLVSVHGVPFREAHAITGRIVRRAEHEGCGLSALSLVAMQAEFPALDGRVFAVLDVERSMGARTSYGGTAPAAAMAAIAAARQK